MNTLSKADVDKGFEFIEKASGSLGTEWKKVLWGTKNLHTNKESPVHGWPVAVVEKALKAIMAQNTLLSLLKYGEEFVINTYASDKQIGRII